MRILAGVGMLVLLGVAGCHSPYMEMDVINATATPVSLVEVDYPSASFGVGELGAGATFHYRFKILGSGAAKVLWTDAERKEHTVAGPEMREGQQGNLTVTISGDTAKWSEKLQ
jgi:hypothetical protein